MTWKTRLLLRESLFTAIAFLGFSYAYWLISLWGIQDQLMEGPLRRYLESGMIHVELVATSLLFGASIGVVGRITDRPRFRRMPFVWVVVVRTVLLMAGLVLAGAFVLIIVLAWFMSWEGITSVFFDVPPRMWVSVGVWWGLVVIGINFSLEISRLLGPSNMWGLFIGRYRKPRVEERVFLFMDLKGSTTLAEQLGHARYSELLQQCFRDLTPFVLRYDAHVYQYVGDEVVLSWPRSRRGDSKRHSVQTFFDYERALREKSGSYEERFGVVPRFRGGIAFGPVTVIEVGDVKREIAYHGDVLNTAARLLGLCKERNEGLVVSRGVGEAVEGDGAVEFAWTESVPLRGKVHQVEACGLRVVSPD